MAECTRLKEIAFLDKYGFKPARRFLLVHRGRYYQSKAIVGAAHGFATGKPLTHDKFSGGKQHSVRVLTSLGFDVVDQPLDDWPLWSHLDRDSRTLARHFPGWKPWDSRTEFEELAWPGVYVIGVFDRRPRRVFPLPSEVVYVGQTTRKLRERLDEFHESASTGRSGHSGGCRFHLTGHALRGAWLSVLPVRLPPGEQRGAITVLEGLLIWAYSRSWGRPPACNSK